MRAGGMSFPNAPCWFTEMKRLPLYCGPPYTHGLQ